MTSMILFNGWLNHHEMKLIHVDLSPTFARYMTIWWFPEAGVPGYPQIIHL